MNPPPGGKAIKQAWPAPWHRSTPPSVGAPTSLIGPIAVVKAAGAWTKLDWGCPGAAATSASYVWATPRRRTEPSMGAHRVQHGGKVVGGA